MNKRRISNDSECIRIAISSGREWRIESKIRLASRGGEWVERCAEIRVLIYAIEKRLTQRMSRSMQQNRSCIRNFASMVFSELCHIVRMQESPRSESTHTRNSPRRKKMLFVCV